MNNNKSLSDIFGHGNIQVLSDYPLQMADMPPGPFVPGNLMSCEALPSRAIVITFSDDAARHTFKIAEASQSSKCIFCPNHVFKASRELALYTLELIAISGFSAAITEQKKVLQLLSQSNEFIIRGAGCEGRVRIGENVKPYGMLREDIQSGFIKSIAEFFEVHYAHMKKDAPCPFSFTGTLKIQGALSVLRRKGIFKEDTSRIEASIEQISLLLADTSGILQVQNNKITSLKIGNIEAAKVLMAAAGPRGLFLTEFAIGVNREIVSAIDYRKNSQLNEGITGLHVAVGDGASGFHLDLLSPNASLRRPGVLPLEPSV